MKTTTLAHVTLAAAISILPITIGATPETQNPLLGLPTERAPSSQSALMTQFGKRLFFDRNLSKDGSISCASCHKPEHVMTDQRETAIGIFAQVGTRNTPSLANAGFLDSFFWDGREPTLESQVRAPLLATTEHALPDEKTGVLAITKDPTYKQSVASGLGIELRDLSFSHIADALAAYIRTLVSGNSRFDRYFYGHDSNALSTVEIRGLELFRGRAGCANCHTMGDRHALLTDQSFHMSPTGLPTKTNERLAELTQQVMTMNTADPRRINEAITTDADIAALGRFAITLNPSDIGHFKTPSLRNVALTSPYLHDGSIRTLEEMVDIELYRRRDAVIHPIFLTVSEKSDLIAFLHALTAPIVEAIDNR